jgi:hypothetical protein
MIFRRPKSSESPEVRTRGKSFDLINLFTYLQMGSELEIAKGTPEARIDTDKGTFIVDMEKLAQEPYILRAKYLTSDHSEAAKIKDELISKDEQKALEYLKANPGIQKDIEDFSYVVGSGMGPRGHAAAWGTLASVSRAIHSYTGKDEKDDAGRSLYRQVFPGAIKEACDQWKDMPVNVRDGMIDLLKKAYGKDSAYVSGVIDHLRFCQ